MPRLERRTRIQGMDTTSQDTAAVTDAGYFLSRRDLKAIARVQTILERVESAAMRAAYSAPTGVSAAKPLAGGLGRIGATADHACGALTDVAIAVDVYAGERRASERLQELSGRYAAAEQA
jgi:hypothetical protein